MPDWKSIARRRLASLRLAPQAESDLTDELAQHLEDLYRDLRSGGATHTAAYEKTLAELDDLYPLRASLERNETMPKHDIHLATGLWKDFRYALRSLRKNPVFVIFVVLTLALGIGANTTVFTLINTVILNPLPIRNLNSLAAVAATDPQITAKSGTLYPLSYADLKDYRERAEAFDSFAAYTSPRGLTWQQHGASQGLFGELVTANYFSTLGLAPALGRFFAPEEDTAAAGPAVAVLNYAAWQKLLGADPAILGRQLLVNNIPLTVVGVAPPRFIGLNVIFGPDIWVPASMAERLFPNSMQNTLTDRAKPAFFGVGRLRPGITAAQAAANIATIAANIAETYPATSENHTATARPIRDVLFASTGSSASPVLFGSAALLIVVGIVLLIACSNVANLLLARSAARHQEVAVRLALGASRSRLIRQFLTESAILGLLSGIVGLALAYAGLQFLFGQLPGSANFPTPNLDSTVFAFALAISLVTGFLFGTIPAFKASRANVADALKESSRTAGRSRSRVTIANGLLVAQVAFSFLLLITAALFLRSIGRAYQMDPGFQTAHLATFPTNPGQAGYTKPQARAYYKEVRDRVLRLPGVEAASWSSNMPLWARAVSGVNIEGRTQRSRADQGRIVINTVSTGYFETTAIPIEAGRAFTDSDRDTTLPVAIVNQKMARDYWPAGALGKRLQLPGETVTRQVVGVARTANYSAWGELPQPAAYVPMTQNDLESMNLYVRTAGDPAAAISPIERDIRAAGPQVLVSNPRTGSAIVDGGLFQARIGVALLTIFGLLALGLASIGLYGVLAYSVNQRKREIGLRMALGATRASVLRLVLKEGMSLVLVGVALGFLSAQAVGQLLSRLLFGVTAADPIGIGAAALALSAVALLACYLPAHHATRVDPLKALHE